MARLLSLASPKQKKCAQPSFSVSDETQPSLAVGHFRNLMKLPKFRSCQPQEPSYLSGFALAIA